MEVMSARPELCRTTPHLVQVQWTCRCHYGAALIVAANRLRCRCNIFEPNLNSA